MARGDIVTVIGRGTHVRGKIAGSGDLEIAGRVDGDVSVDGDVTIEGEGLVASNVSGRRIVVRGAVKGDLVGAQSVALEEGARVVGDVRAPRVRIAAGGLVRGYVQSGDVAAAPARATQSASSSRATPAARPAATPMKAAPAPSRASGSSASSNGSPARPAPPPLPPSVPASSGRAIAPASGTSVSAGASSGSGGGSTSGKQGPPPPVVPALKKGAKGALKKKA